MTQPSLQWSGYPDGDPSSIRYYEVPLFSEYDQWSWNEIDLDAIVTEIIYNFGVTVPYYIDSLEILSAAGAEGLIDTIALDRSWAKVGLASYISYHLTEREKYINSEGYIMNWLASPTEDHTFQGEPFSYGFDLSSLSSSHTYTQDELWNGWYDAYTYTPSVFRPTKMGGEPLQILEAFEDRDHVIELWDASATDYVGLSLTHAPTFAGSYDLWLYRETGYTGPLNGYLYISLEDVNENVLANIWLNNVEGSSSDGQVEILTPYGSGDWHYFSDDDWFHLQITFGTELKLQVDDYTFIGPPAFSGIISKLVIKTDPSFTDGVHWYLDIAPQTLLQPIPVVAGYSESLGLLKDGYNKYYLTWLSVSVDGFYDLQTTSPADALSLWLDGGELELQSNIPYAPIMEYSASVWLDRGIHCLLLNLTEDISTTTYNEPWFTFQITPTMDSIITPLQLSHGRRVLVHYDPQYQFSDVSHYETQYTTTLLAQSSLAYSSLINGPTLLAGTEYAIYRYMVADLMTAVFDPMTDRPATPYRDFDHGVIILSSDIIPDLFAYDYASRPETPYTIHHFSQKSLIERWMEAYGNLMFSGGRPFYLIGHKEMVPEFDELGVDFVLDIPGTIIHQNENITKGLPYGGASISYSGYDAFAYDNQEYTLQTSDNPTLTVNFNNNHPWNADARINAMRLEINEMNAKASLSGWMEDLSRSFYFFEDVRHKLVFEQSNEHAGVDWGYNWIDPLKIQNGEVAQIEFRGRIRDESIMPVAYDFFGNNGEFCDDDPIPIDRFRNPDDDPSAPIKMWSTTVQDYYAMYVFVEFSSNPAPSSFLGGEIANDNPVDGPTSDYFSDIKDATWWEGDYKDKVPIYLIDDPSTPQYEMKFTLTIDPTIFKLKSEIGDSLRLVPGYEGGIISNPTLYVGRCLCPNTYTFYEKNGEGWSVDSWIRDIDPFDTEWYSDPNQIDIHWGNPNINEIFARYDIKQPNEVAIEGLYSLAWGLDKIDLTYKTYNELSNEDQCIAMRLVPDANGRLQELRILPTIVQNINIPITNPPSALLQISSYSAEKQGMLEDAILMKGYPIWTKENGEYFFEEYIDYDTDEHRLLDEMFVTAGDSYVLRFYGPKTGVEKVIIPYLLAIDRNGESIPERPTSSEYTLKYYVPRLSYVIVQRSGDVVPSEMGRYMYGFANYTPSYGILINPIREQYGRIVLDYYRYGGPFNGISLPCLIQANDHGGGFFGYGISVNSITSAYVNTSYAHSYMIATLRQSGILRLTGNYFPDIIGDIGRELVAYDFIEAWYTMIFGLPSDTVFCSDYIPGGGGNYTYAWDWGQSAEWASAMEPGGDGHAGADWYYEPYVTTGSTEGYVDKYGGLDEDSFGEPLKLRPATQEMLSWEVSTAFTHRANGQLKRYPRVNLTGVSIELDWSSPLLTEYLTQETGGNAWVVYELRTTYGYNISTVDQVRKTSPSNPAVLLEEKDEILIDLSKSPATLWDAHAHTGDSEVRIENPHIIVYVVTEDLEICSQEEYDLAYSKLTNDQRRQLLQGRVISARFVGIPLIQDDLYTNSYLNKIAAMPEQDRNMESIMKLVTIGIGIGLMALSAYSGGPISLFWGLDMIWSATFGQGGGFIDTAIRISAVSLGADAETWNHFSIFNIAAGASGNFAIFLNVVWGFVLMYLISWGMGAITGLKSTEQTQFLMKALKKNLNAITLLKYSRDLGVPIPVIVEDLFYQERFLNFVVADEAILQKILKVFAEESASSAAKMNSVWNIIVETVPEKYLEFMGIKAVQAGGFPLLAWSEKARGYTYTLIDKYGFGQLSVESGRGIGFRNPIVTFGGGLNLADFMKVIRGEGPIKGIFESGYWGKGGTPAEYEATKYHPAPPSLSQALKSESLSIVLLKKVFENLEIAPATGQLLPGVLWFPVTTALKKGFSAGIAGFGSWLQQFGKLARALLTASFLVSEILIVSAEAFLWSLLTTHGFLGVFAALAYGRWSENPLLTGNWRDFLAH